MKSFIFFDVCAGHQHSVDAPPALGGHHFYSVDIVLGIERHELLCGELHHFASAQAHKPSSFGD